jgi:hypothetical protein
MKHPIIIGLLLIICASNAVGVTLHAGNTALFEFTDLAVWSSGHNGLPNEGNIKVNGADFYADNLTLQVDLFADSLSESPFESFIISDEPGYSSWGYRNINPLPWLDLQGVVSISVLSGSFDLQYFEVDLLLNNTFYVEQFNQFDIQEVPLPPSMLLFSSGFLALLRLRVRAKCT